MLDIEEILSVLPHRYPFLLVDRILELEAGKRAVGVKNISFNEAFFQGHFPGHPVMPGVIVVEAMAQVGGVLLLSSSQNEGKIAYFGGMDGVRFRKPVIPGDQLVTEAILVRSRGDIGKVRVIGRVNGEIAAEGEYVFVLRKSDDKITRERGAREEGQDEGEARARKIHPSALVSPLAEVDSGVSVGPFCIVEDGVRIGKDTLLESNIVLKKGTRLGQRCHLYPGVVLGGIPQDVKFKGEDSFLMIGDGNIFRECVSIHRATGEGKATVIGDNNMFMAYSHAGHNCLIGSGIMLANSVGISGHVVIEDQVVIGGLVGVHQFVRLGRLAMIGGHSKIIQDVPPFTLVDGRPGRVLGLNAVGLRRSGISQEVRNDLKRAYRILYRSKYNMSQAMAKIETECKPSSELTYFLEFLRKIRQGHAGRGLQV